jgi:hypothetical protein
MPLTLGFKADPSAVKLSALAPSTIVEISNLEEPQQALVFKAIESSDFIGVAAVRLNRPWTFRSALPLLVRFDDQLAQQANGTDGRRILPSLFRLCRDPLKPFHAASHQALDVYAVNIFHDHIERFSAYITRLPSAAPPLVGDLGDGC